MAKKKTVFRCQTCGYENPKSFGKCPSCGTWNDCIEIDKDKDSPKGVNSDNSLSSEEPPQVLRNIKATNYDRIPTKINEFDRVLGCDIDEKGQVNTGMVKDGIVILTAEPGTGKSTILMQVSDNVAKQGYKVLYVSGEENKGQLKSRAERLEVDESNDNIYIISESDMNKILKYIDVINPDLIIIDSIQKMFSPDFPDNPAGKSVQVTACTQQLVKVAKSKKKALFIIGQQTKDNTLAGPREMEHDVDCVIYFESDKNTSLRVMRASKNRFGNTEEIGLFEMCEKGLVSIDNPSDILVTQREIPESGVALTVSLEGNRPLVVEVECLARQSFYPNPMIVSEQINVKKINILTAILGMKGGVNANGKDLFVQVTGGLKINEPAVNLGVLMAMASTILNVPLEDKTVYLGEVSLTGDIKKISDVERRIRELDRLGFSKVYIPKNNLKQDMKLDNIQIIEVKHVRELIKELKDKKDK